MIEKNDIAMVGAVYNVQTGKVHFNNYAHELSQLEGENNAHLASKLNALLEESKIKI